MDVGAAGWLVSKVIAEELFPIWTPQIAQIERTT
jgi:hypothetical protein